MTMKDQKGFTLIEVMVVVLITALMLAGGSLALTTGRSSWFTADAGIQVQENLRRALDQMTAELRQTRLANITVTVGAGFNTSDTINFSIPIICHTGDPLLKNTNDSTNGDVAHWGATLTWGCRTTACMDADNNCGTVDYASIQYELVTGNKLVRKVFNGSGGLVRQDTLSSYISKIQAYLIGTPNQGIHIDLAAQVNSVMKRSSSMTVGNDVIFRNK